MRTTLICVAGFLFLGLAASTVVAQTVYRKDWIPHPSPTFVEVNESNLVSFSVPANWDSHPFRPYPALTPENAFFIRNDGVWYSHGIDYGVIPFKTDLATTTKAFFADFYLDNRHLTEQSAYQSSRLGGRTALALTTAGKYPLTGETEMYVLYTVPLTDSLVFHISTAVPRSDYGEYAPTFERILDSIRFFGKVTGTTDSQIRSEKSAGELTSSVTATGYLDIGAVDAANCSVRIITPEITYKGQITYAHLSDLTGEPIRGYPAAAQILTGKQVSVGVVLFPNRSSTSGPTVEFLDIQKLVFTGISQPEVGPLKQRYDATGTTIDISTDVLFDFNKFEIKDEATPALIRLAQIIRASKTKEIYLDGFTDSVGNEEYNLRLSEKRAAAVRTWLIEKGGLNPNQLKTRAFGESQPVAPNSFPDGSDNPEGRQKNRRVEIRIPH